MIKEIIHDPIFLARPSAVATPDDSHIAGDLIDTITANREKCVGMAANMIGEGKRIIVFDNNGTYSVMYNPEIIGRKGQYETEEGCLSLSGTRKTVRYSEIKVQYLNEEFKPRIRSFQGFTAQIIQHETDHCNGILI